MHIYSQIHCGLSILSTFSFQQLNSHLHTGIPADKFQAVIIGLTVCYLTRQHCDAVGNSATSLGDIYQFKSPGLCGIYFPCASMVPPLTLMSSRSPKSCMFIYSLTPTSWSMVIICSHLINVNLLFLMVRMLMVVSSFAALSLTVSAHADKHIPSMRWSNINQVDSNTWCYMCYSEHYERKCESEHAGKRKGDRESIAQHRFAVVKSKTTCKGML